jgi:hypothetical protein
MIFFSRWQILTNSYLFHINSDGGKLYTEIVYLDNIYNFVLQIAFI